MIIRDTSLAPDVQYFLDSAVDVWELDELSHAGLHLFGDRKIVMDIIDNADRTGRSLAARHGICYRLNEYARSIMSGLDRDHQRSFVACALISEKVRTAEMADVLSSWNYVDQTVGGALEAWRRCGDIRIRSDGTPTPRVWRRLKSPKAVRRYVRHDSGEAVRHHARLVRGFVDLAWPDHPDEARLLDALFAAQEEARERRLAATRDKMLDEMNRAMHPRELPRRLVKQQRKQLARSAALSDQMIGREPTRAFLRGEPVTIPAPENGLVFEIKSERTGAIGHGAVRVSLKADTGDHLAGLCLYFDKTPPLDELVAIALHVDAGNTRSLVETGNLYNISAAGASHPALADRHKPPEILDLNQRRMRGLMFRFNHETQQQFVERYSTEHRSLYQDAILGAVWGRNASRVRRFWATAAT